MSTLTPYNDTWTIKARVAKKEPLRTWEKDGSSRSVFSVELVDEQVHCAQSLNSYPLR